MELLYGIGILTSSILRFYNFKFGLFDVATITVKLHDRTYTTLPFFFETTWRIVTLMDKRFQYKMDFAFCSLQSIVISLKNVVFYGVCQILIRVSKKLQDQQVCFQKLTMCNYSQCPMRHVKNKNKLFCQDIIIK